MEAHEIKYCAFKDESLSIIITELSNRDNSLKNLSEENIISHISSYFLDEPKMQIELNDKLLNFENLHVRKSLFRNNLRTSQKFNCLILRENQPIISIRSNFSKKT